ncbi:hypothetical protein E4U17_003184 [Claviceps sp. LM77 group G4]|nr:hypothetical protein E4U17_003184 [Claviceps sp. LM77 group G4]KAG6071501.1 hypothetical protein E4U16_006071 [Claviceps sp. LM84 group G4]KAG6073027.1 hypothetical protein E4U33_003063 [Claviceps sp. LM78 group G4]
MPTAVAWTKNGIGEAAITLWRWSVPYRSSNRPDDDLFSDVWGTSLTEQSVLDVLEPLFPSIPRHELPTTEEPIRRLVRERLPPTESPPTQERGNDEEKRAIESRGNRIDDNDSSGTTPHQDEKQMASVTEESWTHLAPNLRNLLAAMNAFHLENKLQIILEDHYHPPAGRESVERSLCGINKTLMMWRKGYKSAISRRERYFVRFFFVFLVFSAIYPNVAAGFLGERSYNHRSIGMRIATLSQMYYLWTFPFHSCWLLFNWSLERLLGALVGNTVYAFAAMVPAVHAAYSQSWFRLMMLAVSMSWQLGVQFYPTVRDYIMRLVTRRQMSKLRRRRQQEEEEADGIDWEAADEEIANELMTLEAFFASPSSYMNVEAKELSSSCSWQQVGIRVRTERFIQFTSCFKLGRPADQLVGLMKDDLEGVINTYEDYKSTAIVVRRGADSGSKVHRGHVEPRTTKVLLVGFDMALFAYVCWSFYPQPFTFNTVVAYGTVVTIKQTIVACKRYQTPKSARRLFTNMSAVNILGILLVSTPVTVDAHILDDTGKFVGLTLAMTFATLFLAEPIAPLLLLMTEKLIAGWAAWMAWLRISRDSRGS